MSSINNSVLLKTSVSSLLVIAGVVIKNSLEQMGMKDSPLKMLGMVLFVSGWIYTAYNLSKGRKNKLVPIIASMLILGSAIGMKQYMIRKLSPPMVLPIAFAVSWVVLGLGVGNHLSGIKKYLGLIASICVIVSMMGTLPKQRKMCIVDGPGMVLFTIAWSIISVLNSLRS